jgi:transcriptional regulator with PAS, ATPase and Fis domain
MALRSRIQRLEAASQKWRPLLPELYDPAFERLVSHPDWPGLARELAALIERLIERGAADMAAIRQGIIADERGRETIILMSEIRAGLRPTRTNAET